MSLSLPKDGFQLFPKAVTAIIGRPHADLVPDILRSTKLVSAVKFCTRNTLDPESYTRDLFVLEKVWYPFMSAILALVPLEIEFIVHQNDAQTMRFMPVSSTWKDESPTGPAKAIFVRPTTERVTLAVGDVVVYWSTMVYRIITPNALHLLVPGAISDSAQKNNLTKVAHVPFPADWTPSFAQKACALNAYMRRVSSRYVAEQGLTERQAAEFSKSINLPVISPEYFQPRITDEERKQPVVLNRYDWINPQKNLYALSPSNVDEYVYAFLTRPYRFFALSLLGWFILAVGVLWWLYKRLFGAEERRRPVSRVRSRSRSKPAAKPRSRSKPRRGPKPVVVVPKPAPKPVVSTTPSPKRRRRRKSPPRAQVVIQITK
jgi:hypothetical protein